MKYLRAPALLVLSLTICLPNAANAVHPEPFKIMCTSDASCQKFIKSNKPVRKLWQDLTNVDGAVPIPPHLAKTAFNDLKTFCLPLYLAKPLHTSKIEVPLILKYNSKVFAPTGLDYELFYRAYTRGGSVDGTIEILLGSDNVAEISRAKPTAIFSIPKSTPIYPPYDEPDLVFRNSMDCPLNEGMPSTVDFNGETYSVIAVENPKTMFDTWHLIINTKYGPQSLNAYYRESNGTWVQGQVGNTDYAFGTYQR